MLEPLRSNQPSSFLQDFFPFLQSNRSHNRARSSSNQSIARLFFFFLIKTHDPTQNHALSPIPILFIDSLEHRRKGEGITGEEREDSLPRIDNFLRGENNGIFHRLLIGAEQTIAWSWFREIRPRSEKFSWKGEGEGRRAASPYTLLITSASEATRRLPCTFGRVEKFRYVPVHGYRASGSRASCIVPLPPPRIEFQLFIGNSH